MRQKLNNLTKNSEECKRCLRAKEDHIRCLDLQIDELKVVCVFLTLIIMLFFVDCI